MFCFLYALWALLISVACHKLVFIPAVVFSAALMHFYTSHIYIDSCLRCLHQEVVLSNFSYWNILLRILNICAWTHNLLYSKKCTAYFSFLLFFFFPQIDLWKSMNFCDSTQFYFFTYSLFQLPLLTSDAVDSCTFTDNTQHLSYTAELAGSRLVRLNAGNAWHICGSNSRLPNDRWISE